MIHEKPFKRNWSLKPRFVIDKGEIYYLNSQTGNKSLAMKSERVKWSVKDCEHILKRLVYSGSDLLMISLKTKYSKTYLKQIWNGGKMSSKFISKMEEVEKSWEGRDGN
jgi:hypothetical protein